MSDVLTHPKALPLKERFLKNEDGIAALEFALLAPMLFGVYFGVTVVALAIAADRDVSHATSVIADLATQETELDAAAINNIMTAGVAVLGVGKDKYDASRITMELISYEKTGSTVNRVGYARLGPDMGAYNDSRLAANDRLLSESSGVVVARILYKYDMPIAGFSNYRLAESFVLKPRKSQNVPFGTGTAGGNTFASCRVSTSLIVSGC